MVKSGINALILLLNMMFRGLNKINLDAKGRIAIPVRYKDSLSDLSSNLLICTIDQDHCLLLYPLKFWKSIEKKIPRTIALNVNSLFLCDIKSYKFY